MNRKRLDVDREQRWVLVNIAVASQIARLVGPPKCSASPMRSHVVMAVEVLRWEANFTPRLTVLISLCLIRTCDCPVLVAESMIVIG
jgi:hypothetical protein